MHLLTTAVAIADPELREELRTVLGSCPVRVILDQPAIDSLQLKRLNLDLVFVDAAPAGETLEELIRRIQAFSPSCLITVVSRSADPHMILAAMHAGAHEFVMPPFQERLRTALERLTSMLSAREISSRPAGKTMGFLSAKGGCGATSVACHVAAHLQRSTNHDILLADFDFSAGLVGFLLKPTTSYTVMDAIANVHRLDGSLWKGYVGSVLPRLDVIPAPLTAVGSDSMQPDNLHQVFRLVRAMYGWIVADMGRGLNPFTLELLQDFDELCLVSTPTLSSLYQAKQIVMRVTEHGFPQAHIKLLLNQVRDRSDIAKREIEDLLRIPIHGEIPMMDGLDEAYSEGKLLPASSKLGGEFARLAASLAGLPAPSDGSRGWFPFGKRKPAVLAAGD